MPSPKVRMILRAKTDLPDTQIDGMSDSEGWRLIYAIRPPQFSIKKAENQICFTGFSLSEKERLATAAAKSGLDVVKSVTRSLAYLCAGENAGPAKMKKAMEQEVVVMDKGQFENFLETGEIPMN